MNDRVDDFEQLVKVSFAEARAHGLVRERKVLDKLGKVLERVRKEKGMSVWDLARRAGTSVLQVNYILGKEPYGNVSLHSLFRVAEVLGLTLSMGLRKKRVKK